MITAEEAQCPKGSAPCEQGYTAFSLGTAPCYVGIVSNSFSCVAALVMILIYVAFKDIRKKGAQSIVTFIAIADFFTAAAYLAGSVNILVHYDVTEPAKCRAFETLCDLHGYLVTVATMSSYFWTLALALHLYLTVVRSSSKSAAKLMPLYHVIGWGLPNAVALPLLWTNNLTYAPFVGGVWCYILHNSRFSEGSGIEEAVGAQIPEVISYITIVLFFIGTRWQIHKHTRLVRTSVEQVETLDRVGRILTLIPLLFILLRVWCTVQLIFVHYLYSHKRNGCILSGLRKGYVTFGVLQAIGGGGQGWANAILYIFFSPTIRYRLLISPCKKLLMLRSPANVLAPHCDKSSTYVSQHAAISYGTSASTESIQNLL